VVSHHDDVGSVGVIQVARSSATRRPDSMVCTPPSPVEMPAKQTGSPMSFQIDGKQYLVLAVSGNDGAELIAYALP